MTFDTTQSTPTPLRAGDPSFIRRTLAICFKGVLMVLLALSITGCVAVKNAFPAEPQAVLAAQWKPRYSFPVCIEILAAAELNHQTNRLESSANIESAKLDANRMADILNKCQLFKEVIVSDAAHVPADALVIQALPNKPPIGDPDDAWLILCGGAIPIYESFDRSVRFKYLQRTRKDFLFPYNEQNLIGMWAPVTAAVGKDWHLGFTMGQLDSKSQYWSMLRSALIEEINQADAGDTSK